MSKEKRVELAMHYLVELHETKSKFLAEIKYTRAQLEKTHSPKNVKKGSGWVDFFTCTRIIPRKLSDDFMAELLDLYVMEVVPALISSDGNPFPPFPSSYVGTIPFHRLLSVKYPTPEDYKTSWLPYLCSAANPDRENAQKDFYILRSNWLDYVEKFLIEEVA